MQSIEGGPPRPVTPEGTTEGLFASPDGRRLIAADARGQRFSYSVDGGAPQPIAHLESADNIIGWSSDGRTLFIYRSQDMPLTFRVSRFDPATGRKELVREITPADPVGILADNFNNFVFMTPDGRGYAYSVSRILSDLHLIEGLK